MSDRGICTRSPIALLAERTPILDYCAGLHASRQLYSGINWKFQFFNLNSPVPIPNSLSLFVVDAFIRVAASWKAVSDRLLDLSVLASAARVDLPNGGRPSVGLDGLVREYRGVDTSNLPDPGHRHWSGLWALYPGQQVRVVRGASGDATVPICTYAHCAEVMQPTY